MTSTEEFALTDRTALDRSALDTVQAQLDALGAMQAERLAAVGGAARFTGARRCGTIAALDLRVDGAGYLAAAGQRLRGFALDQGVLLRPLGSTVYVLPPYGISAAELDRVWDAIAAFAP